MTVQDFYRAFENYRRDAAKGAVDYGDREAADREAFEAVVGPLLEKREREAEERAA